MADDRKTDKDAPGGSANYSDESAELKRKLVKRMAVAGVLIAALLGSLAIIDRLGELDEEDADTPPPITTPVPVPQKEIVRPLTPPPPAEPPAAAPGDVPPAAPPGDVPPKPEIAATPSAPPAMPPRVEPAPPRVITSRPIAPAPSAPVVPEATTAPTEEAPPPAAAPPAPVAPTAKPPLPRRGYLVQAGVFTSVQLAEELHAKLTLNGIPSTLETRVQVGPFASQREAAAVRAKLKALGVDSLIIPPPGRR